MGRGLDTVRAVPQRSLPSLLGPERPGLVPSFGGQLARPSASGEKLFRDGVRSGWCRSCRALGRRAWDVCRVGRVGAEPRERGGGTNECEGSEMMGKV